MRTRTVRLSNFAKTTLCGLVLALCMAGAASAKDGSDEARHFPSDEDLTLMLRYLVEDGAAPGIVLGILEADGSTRVVSYGSGGPDTRPLGPRSVFEIGSINKVFTGILLAEMAARGEVSLTDPVSKHLPKSVKVPSRNGREITLLDLATHHSGLPKMPDDWAPADAENKYADFTVDNLYAFLASYELKSDPGSKLEYSNLGMGLLGHALAQAAGKSFSELIQERILQSLGMKMTGFELEGEIARWSVKGHSKDGKVVPFWFGTEAIHGAGGLRSNVGDLLHFLKANVNSDNSGLYRAMREAHGVRKRINDRFSIGLAWQVITDRDRTIIITGGGTGGFTSRIGFDPDKKVGFVLVANSAAFEDDLGMDFLRRGPPLKIREVELPKNVLQKYIGEYELGPGRSLVIKLDGDALTLQAPGNVRFRMYAESDTEFFLKRTPWRLRFTEDDGGEIAGLVVNMNGVDRRARRK
jgi:D-alanyl-D-alanine-carboxypeptidase/D-alanyl-D-alanine-endopeptidase